MFRKEELNKLDKLVSNYVEAENAAEGSRFDANANVTSKNIITLLGEMMKPMQLEYNRHIRSAQLEQDFGKEYAASYLEDIKNHRIYVHDETHTLLPYCASISLFPFLQSGTTCIGGHMQKPKHLSSYCGGLINLLNQLASQVAGAVAVPSLLICFDYFSRKDFGENYLETHEKEINQELQHIIYYLNEPCSGRGGQCLFWNLSIFDDNYLKGLYSDFVYPDDFSKVNFDSVKKLQRHFMRWFNEERKRTLLTFPVITAAAVYDENREIKDLEFKKFICDELAAGSGFFVYLSSNVDSLSSCCRLLNESKNTFSYTLGNVGEMTGSVHVISLNLNRIIQDAVNNKLDPINAVAEKLQDVYKYHASTRAVLQRMNEAGMYPIYDANFVTMGRQFSTIGLIGIVEAAEFLGFDISPNDEYMGFCSKLLKTISDSNKKAKEKYGFLINTEFVPGENAGYKLAQWDKKAGYKVGRDIYNSYFYRVEDDSLSLIDKAKMHSDIVTKYLDGGSAVHYNLEQYLDSEQYAKFLDMNAKLGVSYFCTNVLVTCCENPECGHINKNTLQKCSKCGCEEVSHATRIIGFLKKIKHFSKARQLESARRFYHK